MPLFGHVSLILAADHSKLSKRHGATSVGDFERQGYLPDAMVNFLALLGWNDGSEKEIFTREELIQSFTLERCGPGPVLSVERGSSVLGGDEGVLKVIEPDGWHCYAGQGSCLSRAWPEQGRGGACCSASAWQVVAWRKEVHRAAGTCPALGVPADQAGAQGAQGGRCVRPEQAHLDQRPVPEGPPGEPAAEPGLPGVDAVRHALCLPERQSALVTTDEVWLLVSAAGMVHPVMAGRAMVVAVAGSPAGLQQAEEPPGVLLRSGCGFGPESAQRAQPAEAGKLISAAARAAGLLSKPDTPFVKEAAALLRSTLTTVRDADTGMRNLLGYPLDNTLGQQEAQDFLQGGSLKNVGKEILAVSAPCSCPCSCLLMAGVTLIPL